MNDLPENERFSAYLDGELTAAEQAAVERLLAQSEAARQLMDELRALSATLQALPAHKLPEDFSQQVLRVAQERMAAEPAQSEQAAVVGDGWRVAGMEPRESPPPDTRQPPLLRRALQPRNLLWPAIAVAAAIMIMVMNSDRLPRGQNDKDGDGRLVATAPMDAAGDEGPSIGPAPGAEKAPARRREEEALRSGLRLTEELPKRAPADGAKAIAAVEDMLPPATRQPSPAAAAPAPAAAKSPQAMGYAALKVDNSIPAGEIVSKKSDAPLVYFVQVTPEALRSKAFERVTKLGIPTPPLAAQAGALQANARGKESKASEDRVLEVELTPTQLEFVLVSLRNEPQSFAFVDNPTPALQVNVDQGVQQSATSPAPVAGPTERRQPAAASQRHYGAVESQIEPRGGPQSGAAAFGMGGGGGMGQMGDRRMDLQSIQPGGTGFKSVPPSGSGTGFGGAQQRLPESGAAQVSGGASQISQQKQNRAVQSPAVQTSAPRSQAAAQQPQQVEPKLRVQFVLRVVPGASSAASVAEKDLSQKVEQSKAPAEQSPPVPAAPAKPAQGK